MLCLVCNSFAALLIGWFWIIYLPGTAAISKNKFAMSIVGCNWYTHLFTSALTSKARHVKFHDNDVRNFTTETSNLQTTIVNWRDRNVDVEVIVCA